VARKYWWQNLRMKIIIAVVVIVSITVIALIICASTGVFGGKHSKAAITTQAPAITTTR